MLKSVTGENFFHRAKCDFEVSLNHSDATLLEVNRKRRLPTKTASADGEVSTDDLLPEEVQGLDAVLTMTLDVCKADEQSSVSEEEAKGMALAQTHRMGELSGYKGFEHVNDEIA